MKHLLPATLFITLTLPLTAATHDVVIYGGTSAGVSAATTGTVVAASVSVLLLDYVLTSFWGI